MIDGNNIGSIAAFTPLTVPASSQVNYPVTATLSLNRAVSDLISLITNQSGQAITIELKGFITVNGVQAPIDVKYTISF